MFVKDTILQHLYLNMHRQDTFAHTQVGIAVQVGKSRAHVAIVLKQLAEEGLIECRRLQRVDNGLRRRTYNITPAGIIRFEMKFLTTSLEAAEAF